MFKDIDHTDAVISRLRRATGRRAVAGIFSPGREEQAEKLGYQEFGTPTTPQRQTVAPSFDENEGAVLRDMASDLSDAIEGTLSPSAVADRTAATLEKNLRERIESNVQPPLRPGTIAARRRHDNNSTDTLVDAGDMRDAIECDVWEGEGGNG